MNEYKLLTELLSVKTLLKAASLQKLEAENQDAGNKLRDAVRRGGQYIDIVNTFSPKHNIRAAFFSQSIFILSFLTSKEKSVIHL